MAMTRAHLDGQLRRRQAHRALAEDGDRFAALQLDPAQRAPGRAGAAGDGGPGDEGERVGQRQQRRHRHLHVLRVAAVTAGAVDHRSLEAHLRPARAAVLAGAAAVVMVVHHALADPGFPVGDGGAYCHDHAAGLVTGDHAGRPLDATGDDSTRIGRGAVGVQVAAAHARGLDLEDHVARAGCRIGEPSQLQLAISEKHDAFHGSPPVRGVRGARLTRRSSVLSEACSPDERSSN